MKSKSEAHESLSLMFQRDAVPPLMIVDGLKDQVEVNFSRKCKEYGCYLKLTGPYYPWQNAAEGGIKELKRGCGLNRLKASSPKRLWDDCVELESCVSSHIAHNIYFLHGKTPKTIMSGET